MIMMILQIAESFVKLHVDTLSRRNPLMAGSGRLHILNQPTLLSSKYQPWILVPDNFDHCADPHILIHLFPAV